MALFVVKYLFTTTGVTHRTESHTLPVVYST